MKRIALLVILLTGGFFLWAQEGPKGLEVNSMAPDFKAADQHGKSISLKTQLKKGPVVLVFYRGQWCPYCNKELKALEDSMTQLTAKGASIIAVSPEKQENISKTIEKTKADYPILHDEGLRIMKSYEVAYTVEGAMLENYKKYGIDFTAANGDNGAHLPVPAVYVISREGKIVYRYFEPDYRKRPSVAEISSHL
ncbi:MAG TPA: peroxiredoxin-like family protein [Puia sp.]